MGGSVAIIDYGSGNLRSAAKAFERQGAEHVWVTSDPRQVRQADHIVLPGVGAFGDCRNGLFAVPGMVDCLIEQVLNRKKPFLGICVGMQLMATLGEEHGVFDGLDWVSGRVQAIEPNSADLKIPHMGWNQLQIDRTHPVLDGIPTDAYAYFVHSYHLVTDNSDVLLAHVDYGSKLTAIVGLENMVGTQFHPEKSQSTGLRLISNFLAWKG